MLSRARQRSKFDKEFNRSAPRIMILICVEYISVGRREVVGFSFAIRSSGLDAKVVIVKAKKQPLFYYAWSVIDL